MIVSQIVAMAENRVIGKAGGLPWRIPDELRLFKRLTMGHAIVMGRKTYESIGRPLPGRLNIVVSRSPDFAPPEGVTRVGSLADALAAAEAQKNVYGDEVFIIGGAELYRATLAQTQRIYLTRVHAAPEGDTYFPELAGDEWREVVTGSGVDPIAWTSTVLERIKS